MSHRDHYATLGVPRDAELSLIQSTYWRLARQCKAALTSDPEAPRLLRDLNAAYEVLSTPQLRRQYDELLTRTGAGTENSSRQRWRSGGWRRGPLGEGNGAAEAHEAVPQPRSALPRAKTPETSEAGDASGAPREPEAAREENHDVRESGAGVTSPFRLLGGPALVVRAFSRRLGRLPERLARRAHQPQPPHDGQRAAALRASTAATVARWRQSTSLSDGRSWPLANPGALAPPASEPRVDS